jgi:hypothetical protein
MKQCPWERISDFDGWNEFNRFEAWLREQIANNTAEEVPVLKSYNIGGLKEKWFVHKGTKQVWRLLWPEPPFAGLFEKVT